ncbi:PAS domain-containing sensor histidine kinase [Hymenobacter convexus]|uniref:PAS domain-containing sensor histidine kinase n=1 Tax=Hymenobacter sp. CA1UV-4 TaxID=3063782 RepID=UPI0027132AE4|nr:PAS domain-containing protein [Hymenobacter sp. CA1UV-4]MDO7854766.1 PAS domain-containing protein [Hymenobacter sp. CA1UV-4]
MSDFQPPVPPPDLPASEDLLRVLFDISLNGIMLMRPVYDAAGSTVVDLRVVYLNPAAQQMLQLPERPAESFRTLYPTAEAAGVFAFYRDAFFSDQVERRENNYQFDGLDGYYLLVARRQGDVLVVTFSDTNDQPRTAIEQALRASQARELKARAEAERERNMLQAVLTQSPVAIGVFQGDDCRVVVANDLLCQMWGHVPAQVVGRPLLEGVPELRGQGFTELMQQVARTRQPFVGTEVAADLLKGDRLEKSYFNFVYKPLTDADGAVLGVIDIAVDVTEQVLARRRVQELNEELAAINEELRASNDEFLASNTALAESQQTLSDLNKELESRVAARTREAQAAYAEAERQRARLERLFMEAPAAICVLSGPELVYELVNPDYQALFPGRALLGRPIAEALPEIANHAVYRTFRRVFETGITHEEPDLLIPIARPGDGQLEDRYFNYIQQARYDEHGQIDGVLAFAFEVTQQVRAGQAADAAAQRLRLLTDALPVLISYLDREQRYQFLNHAYRNWFNQDPSGLLGQPAREVLGKAAYANVQGYIARALAGERLSFETRMPYREGFVRHIHTDYIPDVQDGEVRGFYSLVTDITDQTRARERVQELNEELAAINEEMLVANEELRDTNDRLSHTNVDLDTFVYTASHDLKAPIANIEGLLLALDEQLPEPVRQDADVTHLLGLMRGSVDRFQRTLVHLTDVSKLQQAHAEPAETVDLAALVEAVRLDLAPALAATHGQLVIDVADCPTVRFSPKNLRSIVYNLLSNAIKYHSPARPLRVLLRATCPPGQMRLEVQDNGLGLSDAQQAKLFVMFRRLHTHVEGTGVGLYMVKRMVENAGGTIEVDSQPDAGSTFRVLLPELAKTRPSAFA